MAFEKFSQFTAGGDLQNGDYVVGLRDGQNYKFSSPGEGFKDQYGNYLLKYTTTSTSSADGSCYPSLISHTNAAGYVTYTANGTAANIGVTISSKGLQGIELFTAANDGNATTAGKISFNSTDEIVGFSNDVTLADNTHPQYFCPTQYAVKAYVDAQIGGVVDSVSGVFNRITVSGTASDPVVDIAATYVGQTSITTLGTITTGTWNGTLLSSAYGGTGVNNGGSTLTLGGNLVTSGAFDSTFTMTGATNVTFPTTGTLATTTGSITTATNLAGGSANDIPYQTAVGTTSFITETANGVLVYSGAGVPSSSTTLPSGLTIPSPTLTGPAVSIAYVNNTQYVEIGTITNAAFLDFHSDDSGVAVDYDARILSSGGTTGTAGQATLSFIAASFSFNSQVASGSAGGLRGGFILNGNVSGSISIRPQTAAGTYDFLLPTTAGTAGQFLTSQAGSSAMTWTSTVPTSTNLAGGVLGSLPYQSAPSTTLFVAPNTTTALQVLTQTGTGSAGALPAWLTATNLSTASTLMSRDGTGGTIVTLLSFPSTVAAKIALTSTAGFGIAANSILYYLGTSTQTHEFGFGTAAAFTSRFRMALDGTGFGIYGTTSGIVNLAVSAAAGSYSFNLPVTPGSAGQFLTSQAGGSNAMTWTSPATSIANLSGGVLGSVPYQSAVDTTSFVAPNTTTATQVLTQTGTGSAGALPIWITATDAATASTLMTRDASGGTNATLLTFPNVVGSKLALSSGAGFGIAANSILYYLGTSTQTHDFGFGTSGALTLRFRMNLNGNGLGIYGTTSGVVSVAVSPVAGTYNYNLPITSGASGDIQLSGGGGASPMTWLTPGPGVASLLASGFATITSPTVSGALTLNGGVNGGANTAGGGVSVLGAIGSGSGAGGALTLTPGQGGATGVGGNVNITAGQGGSTSGAGGNVTITSGSSTGGSLVGSITIQGANTPGGGTPGGNVVVASGGNSGATTSSISLNGGPGGANGGTGSSVVINSGSASAGGTLVLSSGSAQSGASTNIPGAINIVGGSAPNGGATTNINSNNFTLTNPRGSGTGQVGKINFLADASGTASGNVLHTSVNRLVLNGSVVGMTSAAASTIATVTTASNSMAGGSITYTAESSDGTDFQTVSGRIDFSVVNKAGVLTTNIATATAATAVSAGTFTLSFTFSSSDLRVTPTTSLAATTLRITYLLVSNSQQAITIPA